MTSWLFERIVSIGYYALVDFHKARPTADDWMDSCAWYPVDARPVAGVRPRPDRRAAPGRRSGPGSTAPGAGASLLPERFTMPELQRLHEAVLGRQLDRRNFQKRMVDRGGIERLNERRIGGAHRAPYLYRFTVSHGRAAF